MQFEKLSSRDAKSWLLLPTKGSSAPFIPCDLSWHLFCVLLSFCPAYHYSVYQMLPHHLTPTKRRRCYKSPMVGVSEDDEESADDQQRSVHVHCGTRLPDMVRSALVTMSPASTRRRHCHFPPKQVIVLEHDVLTGPGPLKGSKAFEVALTGILFRYDAMDWISCGEKLLTNQLIDLFCKWKIHYSHNCLRPIWFYPICIVFVRYTNRRSNACVSCTVHVLAECRFRRPLKACQRNEKQYTEGWRPLPMSP